MKKVEPVLFDGKTIYEWNRAWVPVPDGLVAYQPGLRHQVGLFRVLLGSEIVVVGAGTDKGGGLAKRLSDLHRPSDTGRNYHAGRLIYENRDVLRVEVLITGPNTAEARELARQLRTPMIRLHRPSWHAPEKLVQAERARRYATKR